jgi:hypothetical protein
MKYTYKLYYKNNFREGFKDWQVVHEAAFATKPALEKYVPPEPFWKYIPGGLAALMGDSWHEERA